MFENVNYSFYCDTMGRSIVPDEETFNSFVTENTLEFKKLYSLGIVKEVEENGIDKAVCMMIECQYTDEQAAKGEDDNAPASESISGYSYSLSEVAKMAQSANFKTTAAKKLRWVELFCDVTRGVL